MVLVGLMGFAKILPTNVLRKLIGAAQSQMAGSASRKSEPMFDVARPVFWL